VGSGFNGTGSISQYAKIDFKIGGLTAYVSTDGNSPVIDGSTHKPINTEHDASLTLNFKFMAENDNSFSYEVESTQKRGKFTTRQYKSGKQGPVGEELSVYLPDPDRGNNETALRVHLNGLMLRYIWGDENASPYTAEKLPDDTNDQLASSHNSSNQASVSSKSGSNQNQNDTHAKQNPNNPRIQQLITQWINNAEPPKNATEGAQLKYENWGRFHGTTETGVITLNGTPDYAASYPSHFEYLWQVRNNLRLC